jgi:hypothetical protein
MQTKTKIYRNEWSTMLEKSGIWYCVYVRNSAGDVHDKIRCDDYRMALDYWRAFNAIARAAF